jgi:DNA replication protein DnaC
MMMRALKLPAFARHAGEVAQKAEREGWTFGQYLHHLAELETHERRRRRTERYLRDSDLLPEKTLATFDRGRLTPKVAKMLPTLCEGGFVERGDNLLAFGLPGRGKTHLVCAIGHELIQRGYRVLFTATFALVQRLLAAKRDLPSRGTSPHSTATTPSSSTTSAMCSRAGRRWRSYSPSSPSDTSGAA